MTVYHVQIFSEIWIPTHRYFPLDELKLVPPSVFLSQAKPVRFNQLLIYLVTILHCYLRQTSGHYKVDNSNNCECNGLVWCTAREQITAQGRRVSRLRGRSLGIGLRLVSPWWTLRGCRTRWEHWLIVRRRRAWTRIGWQSCTSIGKQPVKVSKCQLEIVITLHFADILPINHGVVAQHILVDYMTVVGVIKLDRYWRVH